MREGRFSTTADPDLKGLPIRIMIVDDSQSIQNSLELFLQDVGDCLLVKQAYSGREALDAMEICNPSLLLLDLDLPDIHGITLAKKVKSKVNPPKIIVITMHESSEFKRAALEAGCDYFIGKSKLVHELPDCIEKIKRTIHETNL